MSLTTSSRGLEGGGVEGDEDPPDPSVRRAGEADIIAVDRKGNIKMYDIKAGKYSFHPFMDRYGRTVDYFTSKHRLQTMSLSEYTGRLPVYI
jgi:hypothetical protein